MTKSCMRKLMMAAAALAVGAAGASLSGPLHAQVPTLADAPDATRLNESAPFRMAKDDVLFRAFGESMTVGRFEDLVRYTPPAPLARPGVIQTKLADATADQVREAVRIHIRNEAMRRQAEEHGLENMPVDPDELARALVTASQLTWIDEVGLYDSLDISEDDVRERYEEVKEETYRQEEQLTLRHIFFSTYEIYEVIEGDTLESIAERITGDASAVDRILSAETRRPRIEEVETEQGENLPPRALRAGEELMVPGGPEKLNEVRAVAQAAFDRINAGEEFTDVAAEMSETGGSQRPIILRPERDEKPMIPEVLEAFHELENGGVSEPFQTRHGFQIVKRVAYRESGFTPFESVEAALRGQIENERRQQMYDDLMAELWEQTEVIELNEDLLARVFDDTTSEDEVLFEIDGVLYPVSSYRRDYGQRLDADSSLEERRAVMINQPIIQRTLLEEDINRREVRGTEVFRQRVRALENQAYAQAYAGFKAREYEPEISDEKIQERFAQMEPALRNRPSLDLWRISIDLPLGGIIDDDWIERRTRELEDRLADVSTVEEFEALARDMSTDNLADEGGRIGRVGQSAEDGLAGRLIQDGRTNRPTEVVRGTNNVRAYWVGEIYRDSIPQLENHRETIVNQIANQMRGEFYQRFQDEALDGVDYEILIP